MFHNFFAIIIRYNITTINATHYFTANINQPTHQLTPRTKDTIYDTYYYYVRVFCLLSFNRKNLSKLCNTNTPNRHSHDHCGNYTPYLSILFTPPRI